jgi:hypothetical protein
VKTAELARWHVGPWTARATRPGEPLQPGVRRTPDELNLDIIGLARILGRRLSVEEEQLLRRCQAELRPTDPRPCGIHTLTDPENARLLAETARLAFEWIAGLAPAGYEFVLTDAVYLEPVKTLSASVVPVETVVQAALDRDSALPAARLALAEVRRSAGGWVVGDAVCNWSGPYSTADEAVAVVTAARAELVDQLLEAGHDDLAATASRWAGVSVPSY